MVTMRCLSSSSAGNCYLLTADSGDTLIVECGVNLRKVKRALGWDISRVAAAVATHEHNDHSGYVAQFVRNGIQVFALPDVFAARNCLGHPFAREIEAGRGYLIGGGFKVFAPAVPHDVPCVAFIIEHPDMGRLFFATDTMMLEFRLPPVDHIMIEANYSDAILDGNIRAGRIPSAMRSRLTRSHMELNTTLDVLTCNNIERAQEVVLLHLSKDNADPPAFQAAAEQATGKPVYIAEPGLIVEFNEPI